MCSTKPRNGDLVTTVQDEAERLNRFIANLLDMTKLETGALEPKSGFHDLGEIIGTALQRAGKVLADTIGFIWGSRTSCRC